MKSCMLSVGHDPYDDRIYYKETLSIMNRVPMVIVIAPGKESENRKNSNIEIITLRKSGTIMKRLLNIYSAIRAVIRIKPRICHFHDYELIFALPFFKLLLRGKFIYDVHEVYPEMAEKSEKIPKVIRPVVTRAVDLCERLLSLMADYIIASDDNIAQRFKLNQYVATIYNYPRLELFEPDPVKISELKIKFQGKTPVIYQGGMSEDRGLFKMIEAMDILRNERPEVILLLVGEMEEKLFKRAREEIKRRNLKNSIEITGWITHEDIVNYITVSRIGLVPLLPTRKFKKNIPIKQFEYMACGVPVLGADLPPISSYILEAGCGKVYDSTSSNALAEAVINMLNDEKEWMRMSEAGKKAVQTKWNWHIMEKKLFNVYDQMLES